MYTSLPNTFTPGITVSVSGTMPALATGSHTVYVHGMDVANNWGPFQSAVILVDTTGPTTSALGLSPDPTNGTVAVALSATANDTATGGSNIAAAEYTIDSGAYTSMTVSPSGVKIASLTASIPAATVNGLTPEGTHVVSVRSQDSLGNWGSPPATINLIVDKTGPVTSNVTVANASPAGVRVRADFADTLSNINRAEGYVDNDPGVGKGFVFTAIDGLFNSKSEPGYADMPQSIFNTLGSGTHSVFVRAKDAAGNWGSTSSTVFVLFADGFESGDFTKWSTTGGTPGRISVTLGGQGGGTRKMQAAISSGTSGYVQDNTPANETSYRARFYFNPNGYTTGNGGNPTPVTIFSGLNTASATVFQVQYRRSSNTGYQVCLVVSRAGGGGGTTSTSWYTINNNAWNAIEIAWQSAASASASLYTGGTLRQTLTVLNTSGFTLDTVRLGPQGTGLPNSGTVYFDSFISTRNLYIGP